MFDKPAIGLHLDNIISNIFFMCIRQSELYFSYTAVHTSYNKLPPLSSLESDFNQEILL